MKILTCILTLLALYQVNAGSYRDMQISHPDKIALVIKTGSYNEVLQLARDSYKESEADNNDPVSASICIAVLSHTQTSMQIPLAIEFALSQSSFRIEYLGTAIIKNALLNGLAIDETRRAEAKEKLKNVLPQIHLLQANHSDKLKLTLIVVDTLILLKDDAGLDCILTSSSIVDDYKTGDSWDANSNEIVFAKLTDQYQIAASSSGVNGNSDPDKLKAAIYELCRMRRLHGVKIAPIHPLIDFTKVSS